MKTAAAVHATPELRRRAITGADALDYIGDLLPELTRLAQLASTRHLTMIVDMASLETDNLRAADKPVNRAFAE